MQSRPQKAQVHEMIEAAPPIDSTGRGETRLKPQADVILTEPPLMAKLKTGDFVKFGP